MLQKGYDKTYDFSKSKTVCVSGNEIRNDNINMHTANDEQSHLAKYIKEFKIKTNPQNNSNLKKVK